MQKKMRNLEKEKRELTSPLQKVNAQVKEATVSTNYAHSIHIPCLSGQVNYDRTGRGRSAEERTSGAQ